MAKPEAKSFFNQLGKSESLDLFKECAFDHSKFAVVQENQVQAFHCTLDQKKTYNKFYVVTEKKNFSLEEKYSFCLKVFNKVYFFKSPMFQDALGIYLPDDIVFYELQRRNHTRFEIPYEWAQSCSILQNLKRAPKIGANVINLSWSGIRIKVGPQLPEFKLKQEIQFLLRIHRRAAFLVTGEIIYIKKNKTTGPILGIRFNKMSHLLESKIQNICEDLLRYVLLKQNNNA